MTLFRTTSIALILTVPLVMGACSPKDKGPSAEKSAPAKALGLSGPSDKVFSRHFVVEPRNVPEAEAKQALADLKLLKPSGQTLKWAKSSGKNGNYVYSDLSVKSDDGMMTIDKAELFGVHMDDDIATFDRADFSGMKIYDEKDDTTVTIDEVSIAKPTPDMARSIIESLESAKDLDSINIEEEDLDLGFGAIGVKGFRVKSDEVDGTMGQLVWGQDETTRRSDFKVEDVDFKMEGDEAFTASLDLMSMTDMRADIFGNMPKNTRGATSGLMSGLNPLAKSYDTMKMDNLKIDSRVFSVTSEGFEGKSTEKNGVTTIREVSQPFIIRLKEAPKDAQAAQIFETIKSLDFDEIVLQSSQTSVLDSNTDKVTVKDGLISMKDGFNLSYNFEATGATAFLEKVEQMEANAEARKAATPNYADIMDSISINGLQFRLEDKSIVERGIKLASQFRGASPSQVKKEMKVALALAPITAGSGLERDIAGELSSALSAFIDNGGTLSIVLDPSAPLPVSELADYKGNNITIEKLGFSAKTE